jgi:hypothetical protein
MKHKADYSTTIIYKITCNDPNITDKYVGHTTDIVRRRQAHKNNTCNENSVYYNLKLYKFIREHGGWDNWKMEIIAHYNCKNMHDAKIREQAHYTELKASLNSIEPLKLKETAKVYTKSLCDVKTASKFHCEKCHYTCYKKSNWDKHIETLKHSGNQKVSKKLATCELCDYTCCKQYLLDKHKMTNKHKLKVAETASSIVAKYTEAPLILPSDNGKLSKLPNDYMAVISQLLNQNSELTNFIIEQANEHKNFIIKQAAEHKKDTLEIANKILEKTRFET